MLEKKKNRFFSLSKDAKYAHRLWSVWLSLAVVVVSTLEALHLLGIHVLPLWRDVISQENYPIIVATLGTVGVVARLLRQACLDIKETANESESDQTTAQ